MDTYSINPASIIDEAVDLSMRLAGTDFPISIFPTKIRQLDAWVTVQRGHAVANGLPVIAVNRVGHEPDPSGQTNGIQFWGNSFVAGPQGEILVQASNMDEENMVVELDMTRSENVRRWWPFLRDRRIDEFENLTRRFID